MNDARGALALFAQLGFERAAPMLVDDGATGRAIQSLVTDDLVLGPEDSLVLFYSGHGVAPKGEQLYLEFAWHRSGGYLRELDRVKASIHWFVGAAKNRFR